MSANDSELPLAKVGQRQTTHKQSPSRITGEGLCALQTRIRLPTKNALDRFCRSNHAENGRDANGGAEASTIKAGWAALGIAVRIALGVA